MPDITVTIPQKMLDTWKEDYAEDLSAKPSNRILLTQFVKVHGRNRMVQLERSQIDHTAEDLAIVDAETVKTANRQIRLTAEAAADARAVRWLDRTATQTRSGTTNIGELALTAFVLAFTLSRSSTSVRRRNRAFPCQGGHGDSPPSGLRTLLRYG